MDFTFEKVEQPPLKPLEAWWWEETPVFSLSEETKKALQDGEDQRLRDAERGGSENIYYFNHYTHDTKRQNKNKEVYGTHLIGR